MKPLSDQTHYDILEIGRDATPDQLERAYRIARATYTRDSLATYSVYDETDLSTIQERIELAHRVLSDPAQRQGYDEALGGAEKVELALSFADVGDDGLETTPEIRGFEEGADDGPYDGARLRRTRLARGVELDRIAATTKINPTYLRFIEDDRYQDLPANVYVRGFVGAYARCLGLDPDRVVPGYMERVLAARPDRALHPTPRRMR